MSNATLGAAEIRPWQLGSFDANPRRSSPAAAPAAAIKLPTADEIAALSDRAYREGFEQGQKDAHVQTQRIAAVANAFEATLSELQAQLAPHVMTLAIDIARAVIREALATQPELVLPVVREALEALVPTAQGSVLSLHPSDLELVKERLGDELAACGWRVTADERIGAGGCKVETAQGDVQGSISQRWSKVLANLGRDDAWLA